MAQNTDMRELAGAIVGAVNEAAGPRKVSYDRFIKERSVHKDKPKLTRRLFHNGILLTNRSLTADDIMLANRLVPGDYCNYKVKVVPVNDGNAHTGFDIRHACKTADQRNEMKNLAPTFTHLLAKLVKEAQARESGVPA